MLGINLNEPITYRSASKRIFEFNEKHVTRYCKCDVLLLVYDGILRFSENGVPYEVHSGEYFIQKGGCYQSGYTVSDSPKYLYVHFHASWTDCETALPKRGIFDYNALSHLINELDKISHDERSYIEKSAVFFTILSAIYRAKDNVDTLAKKIADFIDGEYLSISSLEDICARFHYSKNHIINVFKREYGITPFEYINDAKIRKGMYLLEVTSKPIEQISQECGFNHYSHFYRLFVRKNGVSPFEWRCRREKYM